MAGSAPDEGIFSRLLDSWWPTAIVSPCDKRGRDGAIEGPSKPQKKWMNHYERMQKVMRWLDVGVGWAGSVIKKAAAWAYSLSRKIRLAWSALRDWLCPKPMPLRGGGDGLSGVSDGWHALKNKGPNQRVRMSKVMRWLDISLRILIGVFLLGLLLNVIEPFGLSNATKTHSQRIAARGMSPLYGSPAQDHIAVVLIDEKTLEARQMGWPPQYSYYDELLRRILAQQPRAVYLDILMEQRRSYDSSFEDARAGMADEIEAAGIPVFFGVSAPGARSIFSGLGYGSRNKPVGAMPVNAHMSSSTAGVALDVVTSWQGTGTAYPLLLAAENVSTAAGWKPPLSKGPGVGADYRSVALALYQTACVQKTAPGCVESARELSATALATPMAVQWGVTNPVMADAPDALDCVRDASAGNWERLRASFSLLVDSLFSGMDARREDRNRAHCPYTLTVFEEQLDDEALGEVLKDRVVLVGTRLVGLNDSVLSPVHQQIPGVYLHAMALDNLMTWGSERVRRDPGVGWGLWLANALLISLAVGFVFMVTRKRCLSVALLIVLVIPISVLMVVLAQWGFRQPPQDWIGALMLVSTVTIYAWNRDVKRGRNSQP